MGKYVRMLSAADLRAECEAGPAFAKFMAEKGLNNDTIGASMEVMLPDVVKKWIAENEPGQETKAQEAFTLLLNRCAEMLMGALPKIVHRRMKPVEAIEVLADEALQCVYALPFERAGVPAKDVYLKLADITLAAGALGVMLSTACVCAEAHKAIVKIAEGREDLPDLDPALAAKATHREHATVN